MFLFGLVLAGGLLAVALSLSKVSTHTGCARPPAPRIIGAWPALATLLEQVPCPSTGHSVYDLHDDRGVPMEVLDPIADPAGGYLGVYHSLVQPWNPSGGIYEVLLAHSDDLIHWRQLAVLDARGAAMPTLRAIPGRAGFLLASEKAAGPSGGHVIRVSYYRNRSGLLGGRPAAAIDLPLRYSPLNNGTPAFLSIDWRGGLRRSRIGLSFHYQLADGPSSGQDREAVGTLSGFRVWRTHRARRVDRLIASAGLGASHGDERQFTYGGADWRVYEASAVASGFAGWHVVLYRVGTDQLYPLTFETTVGTVGASFGNPIVNFLPSPHGRGDVMVMTVFVFSSGPAARDAGELLFYRPV